jgi:hypothetical protein
MAVERQVVDKEKLPAISKVDDTDKAERSAKKKLFADSLRVVPLRSNDRSNRAKSDPDSATTDVDDNTVDCDKDLSRKKTYSAEDNAETLKCSGTSKVSSEIDETSNGNMEAMEKKGHSTVEDESGSTRRKTRSGSESNGCENVERPVIQPKVAPTRLTRSSSSEVEEETEASDLVASTKLAVSSSMIKESKGTPPKVEAGSSWNREEEKIENELAGQVVSSVASNVEEPVEEVKADSSKKSPGVLATPEPPKRRGRPRIRPRDEGETSIIPPLKEDKNATANGDVLEQVAEDVMEKKLEDIPKVKGGAAETPAKRRRLLGPSSQRQKRPRRSTEESDDEPKTADVGASLKRQKKVEEEDEESPPVPQLLRNILRCQLLLVNTFQRQLRQAACGHCQATGSLLPDTVVLQLSDRVLAVQCSLCQWTTVRRISTMEKTTGEPFE